MIYCVVPEELAPELYDRLADYYKDDPNVKVIIDRRKSERRGTTGGEDEEHQRETRDRRRPRVPGEFPPIDSSVVRCRSEARRPRRRRRPGQSRARRGRAVLSTPDGEVVDEATELLGDRDEQRRGVPRPAARARPRAKALGATEVEIVNDSELIAKQVNGQYKVKHPAMRPLYLDAMAALGRVPRVVDPLGSARPERRRRRAGEPGARRRSLRPLVGNAPRAWGPRGVLHHHGRLRRGALCRPVRRQGVLATEAPIPANPRAKTQFFGVVRTWTSRVGGGRRQATARRCAVVPRLEQNASTTRGSNCVSEQSRSSRSASSGDSAAL